MFGFVFLVFMGTFACMLGMMMFVNGAAEDDLFDAFSGIAMICVGALLLVTAYVVAANHDEKELKQERKSCEERKGKTVEIDDAVVACVIAPEGTKITVFKD